VSRRWQRACRAALAVVALAACGDNSGGPVPEVKAGCREVPWTSDDQFSTSRELGDVVSYTLEDWQPTGRYFFTGAYIGNGSIMFDSELDDRFETQSSSELFHTFAVLDVESPMPGFEPERFTDRISNLREDGTLRYDYAYCRGKTCDVCTAGMIRAERHDPQESDKLALVSELNPMEWKTNGVAYDVKVVANTAYVIRDNGLYTIDVTNPMQPMLLGHQPDSDRDTRSNDVAIVDGNNGRRYALIADSPVRIVDVTNPLDLQPAGQINLGAHTLFTETRNGSTRAYFGSFDGTTPVYDITDPTHPARLGAFDTGASYVHDLFVQDGIAYLNASERGLYVVDYNVPATPTLLGRWQSAHKHSHSTWVTTVNGRRVAIHGEELYDAYASIIDVDPASPQFMTEISTYQTREYISIHNFTGVGTKAYFTHYQDGVRVLDLANPEQPQLVGYYNTWDPLDPTASRGFFGGAIGLDVDAARKLIFVVDLARGFLVLRDDT